MIFAYAPLNEDELELVVGETLEVIKEVHSFIYLLFKTRPSLLF